MSKKTQTHAGTRFLIKQKEKNHKFSSICSNLFSSRKLSQKNIVKFWEICIAFFVVVVCALSKIIFAD